MRDYHPSRRGHGKLGPALNNIKWHVDSKRKSRSRRVTSVGLDNMVSHACLSASIRPSIRLIAPTEPAVSSTTRLPTHREREEIIGALCAMRRLRMKISTFIDGLENECVEMLGTPDMFNGTRRVWVNIYFADLRRECISNSAHTLTLIYYSINSKLAHLEGNYRSVVFGCREPISWLTICCRSPTTMHADNTIQPRPAASICDARRKHRRVQSVKLALLHYERAVHMMLQIARNKFQHPPRFSTLHSPRHLYITQLSCWRNRARTCSLIFSLSVVGAECYITFCNFFATSLFIEWVHLLFCAKEFTTETSLTGPLFALWAHNYIYMRPRERKTPPCSTLLL